ncbi:MAG: hypothetical protein J5372_03130 [Lachnospiraceae bacterium]|nr:hypothetical protein [Lachnospiraceae bacterium]
MTEMAVFDHRDGSLIEKDFARRRLTPAAPFNVYWKSGNFGPKSIEKVDFFLTYQYIFAIMTLIF